MFAPNPSGNPSGPAALQPQSSDVQQLVGLLGSLMPLLLRFQSQTFEQQPFAGSTANFVIPNPALDHQAAENLVSDIIAGSLRRLSRYLEVNAGRYAGLENGIPIVTQAAHRFAARDYAEAFNLIWWASRTIEAVRAAEPQLPPLRAGGQASADQTSSSIH
jgi:hypothetical protein